MATKKNRTRLVKAKRVFLFLKLIKIQKSGYRMMFIKNIAPNAFNTEIAIITGM